jgi:hypothetical protein
MRSTISARMALPVFALALLAGSSCTNPPEDRHDTFVPDAADEGSGETDGDETDGAGCIDGDGDGYGTGCAAGLDCNDADPAHHDDCPDCDTTHAPGCACDVAHATVPCYEGPAGTEGVGICRAGERSCVGGVLVDECLDQILPVDGPDRLCNNHDDDCDGVGDEALYGPCGDCDVTCDTSGDVVPLPDDPGASGLDVNPDGPGVVVGGGELISAPYLWAANYDGTVSKLDLETGAEVSRYRVGLWGNECESPSRTAVDGVGNAYVASRALSCGPPQDQGSVTKMAGDRRFCIDRDRDGDIDTSTGSVALPLYSDECVLFTVRIGGAGAIPRGVAIDLGDEAHPWGFPWVGAYNEMRAYKVAPTTGEVLATVNLSVSPYGLAADGLGGIWVSSGPGAMTSGIQYFNTMTGTVQPPVVLTGCSGGPYGIAVDRTNRVWVATYGSSDGCAARWDPVAGTWMNVRLGGYWDGRGIAVGSEGTVWMAAHGTSNAMFSWNGEDGSDVVMHTIAGVTPVGIGLDDLGHVWTVNQGTNNVTRLTIATGVMEQFPVGDQPYTYSDFTGYQRRVIAPDGMWEGQFERCARGADDRWGDLTWDVTAPPGELTITAKSADTIADLAGARLVSVAVVPDATPPVDIEALFAGAGETTGRFLHILVTLRTDSRGRSPVFRSVAVRWHCGVVD